MCGEQLTISASVVAKLGSPPRVRGTGLCPGEAGRIRRITPACAGNRFCCIRRQQGQRDHPRVCGEQTPARSPVWGMPGSPPRVRGTANALSRGYAAARITPACAGNSCGGKVIVPYGKDHPRVCGEQKKTMAVSCWGRGSPPRVRGTELF